MLRRDYAKIVRSYRWRVSCKCNRFCCTLRKDNANFLGAPCSNVTTMIEMNTVPIRVGKKKRDYKDMDPSKQHVISS